VSKIGLLLLVACSGVVLLANVALRWAMDNTGVKLFSGGLLGVPREVFQLVREPAFVLAVACYGLAMLMWFRLIATEPLSISYPALAAVTFVAVSLAGVVVFHEPMNYLRGLGLFFIIIGVILATVTK
jgi:multidrug transporter EmrE-like cation transporter